MKLIKEEFEKMLLEGLCLIPLGKGYYTEVSEEDWSYLLIYNWTLNKYVVSTSRIYGKNCYMHKIIAERMGLDISNQIDHIDRNIFNNKRDNFRSATNAQNQYNVGLRSDNTTGYPGVCYMKDINKYTARIQFNGKRELIGFYNTAYEAHLARQERAIKLYGEFYNPNF